MNDWEILDKGETSKQRERKTYPHEEEDQTGKPKRSLMLIRAQKIAH